MEPAKQKIKKYTLLIFFLFFFFILALPVCFDNRSIFPRRLFWKFCTHIPFILFPFLYIFTISSNFIHTLYIFAWYNIDKLKDRHQIRHIDKFFHNKPRHPYCRGTPHCPPVYGLWRSLRHSPSIRFIASFRDIIFASSLDMMDAHSCSSLAKYPGAFPSYL
mgnify:CR=1 FL=1